ncbi:MAG: HlyC/CorC family transporter [Clostridia bacterium]|nr:HlyC/CorC family transporter [Clostridia bacterium]
MNLSASILVLLGAAVMGALATLTETAILSASLTRAKQRAEDGEKNAQHLVSLRTEKKVSFATLIRLITVSCIFIAAVITRQSFYPLAKIWLTENATLSEQWTAWLSIVLVSLAVSAFLIIHVSLLPRKFGAHFGESIAYAVAGISVLLTGVFTPYIVIVQGISGLIAKLFGVPTHAGEKIATEDEIMMMVDASGEKGVIEESEADMIANIFEFGDTTASEAMTHRTDVEALEYTTDVRHAVRFALENGFSRIPVYKDDLDNIQGVLYVKDLLKFVGNAEQCDTPIYKLMRPASYIPETKKLSELFGEMTETKVQMAIVVDEYGGTSGIITMEDLIESILGNIQDEFDNEDEEISRVGENTFTIDGTASIYEVSDLLGIEIPEGDYDTLAGYIVSTLGRIPGEDEHPTVRLDGYEFMVEQVADRRITRVHVTHNA